MNDLNQFIGINYIKGGFDLSRGVDCWGLVVCAMRSLYGIEITDSVGCVVYGDELSDVIENEAKKWTKVLRPMEGDVVTMCKKGGARPVHVGIYVGMSNVLHILNESTLSCLTNVKIINRMFSNVEYYRHDSNL